MEGASKLRFTIEEKNNQQRLKLVTAMVKDFSQKVIK
jgi:transcription-repair coupling factor (superfamily II helicase)